MLQVDPGDQVVIRAWQWDEARLRQDAELDFAEQQSMGIENADYSISVFMSEACNGEAVDELKKQPLERLTAERRVRRATYTTRRRLEEAGFTTRLNEPPPGHYDVVLGTDLSTSDVAGLASVFGQEPRERVR